MTLAEQQIARIDLCEVQQIAVDFSEKPLSAGEITFRNKLFVLGEPTVTRTLIDHFLPPYRLQGAHIFCLDTDGSLREPLKQLGASKLQYTALTPLQFNPFLKKSSSPSFQWEERIHRILMAIWKPEFDSLYDLQDKSSQSFLDQQILLYAIRGYTRLVDDCSVTKVGFNTFFDYLQGDFKAFLRDDPRFSTADLDDLLRSFEPYYRGGALAFLLNAETPVEFEPTEEVFYVDLSELQHQPSLRRLVSIIVIELISTQLYRRRGIRKVFLFNESLVQTGKLHAWETYRALIKTARTQFGECWLITNTIDLTEGTYQELASNRFLSCFSTAMLVHPVGLSSAERISQWLQLLNMLVEGKALRTDMIGQVAAHPQRVGLYSLTQTGLRTFLLPSKAH